jgi:hypothetical protein
MLVGGKEVRLDGERGVTNSRSIKAIGRARYARVDQYRLDPRLKNLSLTPALIGPRVNGNLAGRTSYFYCVSVQERSGPCEVGKSMRLKKQCDIVRNEPCTGKKGRSYSHQPTVNENVRLMILRPLLKTLHKRSCAAEQIALPTLHARNPSQSAASVGS